MFKTVGHDCKDEGNEYNCNNNYGGDDDTREKKWN